MLLIGDHEPIWLQPGNHGRQRPSWPPQNTARRLSAPARCWLIRCLRCRCRWAWCFGTAGLPHILMRFFTVPNAQEARKSVFVASGFIGLFFLVVTLGLAAISIVGNDPHSLKRRQGGRQADRRRQYAGHAPGQRRGRQSYLGFMSAVAFATILAVVSGLALAGASAIAHDIYARVMRGGKATEAEEMRVSRWASAGPGRGRRGAGHRLRKSERGFPGGPDLRHRRLDQLPDPDPVDVLERPDHARAALIGGIVGLVSAVTFVVLSKAVWVVVLNNPAPIFPYEQTGAVLHAAGLLLHLAVLGDRQERPRQNEIDAFDDQYVRSQTGIGAAAASNH